MLQQTPPLLLPIDRLLISLSIDHWSLTMTLYHHDAHPSTSIPSVDKLATNFYFDSMHDNVSSGSPPGHNDGKSCHPGSATGKFLYCNNVLPGIATGSIFQLPTAYSAVQEQEQGNFSYMATFHQDQEQGNISNIAKCHQDPEPELDYRFELDVLW